MESRELELQAAEGTFAGAPVEPERLARFARLLGYDERLLLHFRRYHGPWRTRLAHLLTAAGDARSWTAAALALIATARRPAVHLGLRVGLGALAGALAAQVLKRTLNRARPTSAIAGFEALAENPDAFSRLEPISDPLPRQLALEARHAQELDFAPPGDLADLVDASALAEARGAAAR